MTSSGRRQAARRIRPFTPAQESAVALSQRTVGRDEVLQVLVARLISAATSRNRPHSLLVGPRGSGKTHLLNVAIYRARSQSEAARALVFVRFDEDAVGITRYFDLLHEVLVHLAPNPPGRRAPLPANPEEAISTALGDRVLVLVIENLDRIFHALGEGGQQDFRSWVENSGQIMVLATAPLLFRGVQDRAMPWWGNFGISHLDELDLDQGREILIRLAAESGDAELADFLATATGQARLRALNAVAGGSPRIWMILSECLTVELLDELVPAVEALLEGLVPYYQQLLWDLSPVEQRLVRALADGPRQAMTVAELAEIAGIGQRVAATTLGRLADIRWVRAEKAQELDQRSSWYRLREPMVRHHFHYRSATDQPLPLIVEILKIWYDPTKRRTELIRADPASETERLLAAALSSTSDLVLSYKDIDSLSVDARRWIHDGDALGQTHDAGALIDVAIAEVQSGPEAAAKVATRRGLANEQLEVATALIDCGRRQDEALPTEARVAELVGFAAQHTSGHTGAILELVSACLDGDVQPEVTRDRLIALQAGIRNDDPLWLNVACASVLWTCRSGELVRARGLLDAMFEKFCMTKPEVLQSILNIPHRAALDALADGPANSREILSAFIPLYEQRCGLTDSNTGFARSMLALHTLMSGDPVSACELAVDVLNRFEYKTVRLVAMGVAEASLMAILDELADSQEPLTDIAEAGVVGLLQAAVNGSAEALVRLPSELVPIVEAMREQRSGDQPAPAPV